MKTISNLSELVRELTNDTKVRVAGLDVDGVLRGKIMSKDKFLSLFANNQLPAFGFCGVVYGWDMHDEVYGKELKISNLQNGYADILALINLESFRRIPFENNIPFFLVTFLHPDSREPLFACPRATLQKVLKRLDDAFQLEAYAGAEYEYFQFKETAQSVADKQFHNLQPLTPGMHGYSITRTQLNNDYFHALWDQSAQFGIDIEGHHTETGPGVYETALAYTNALKMADNAVLFKFLAKTVGAQYGIMPSFMAKPHNNLPGCSGHVHISLRNKKGENIFGIDSPREDAKYDDLKYVSKECEHFLAGIIKGMADIMPCFVPTINGYKRLVEHYWAPTSASWGYESRICSLRIIGPPGSSKSASRIEVRVPGADMNPHFTIAAIIGLGLLGMQEKIEIDLPPVTAPGNKEATSRALPKNLKEATERMMRPDSYARKIFGDDFVDHFGETRLHEWRLFEQTVTTYELARYLELA